MISLELARKLKEAGLEWEPKFGDHYIIPAVFEEGLHEVMDTKQIMSYHKNPEEWEESIKGFVFAPRLDQLLAKIEKRGYTWLMQKENIWGKYCFSICPINAYKPRWNDFWGNTPTDAAAEALLWICDRGADRD